MNKFHCFIIYSILSAMFALVGIVFIIWYTHAVCVGLELSVMGLVPFFLLCITAFTACGCTGFMSVHFFLSWRKGLENG